MKPHISRSGRIRAAAVFLTVLLATLLACGSAYCQSRSSPTYALGSEGVSGGAGESSSASYSSTGSSGLQPPTQQSSPEYDATPQLAGQLAVPLGFAVGGPDSVAETDSAQYRPATALDDGTFEAQAAQAGDAFDLAVPSDFATISSASGFLATGAVLAEQSLTVRLTRGAQVATRTVALLNTIPDNFGTYAADGIDDGWQVDFFGLNNVNAGPLVDVERDGLTNFAEYVFGLSPLVGNLRPGLTGISGNDFEYVYERSSLAARNGAVFTIEWNDTVALTGWSTLGVTQTVLSDNGTVQRVRATVPRGLLGRRFARVVVR